jgi:hypothetical protein
MLNNKRNFLIISGIILLIFVVNIPDGILSDMSMPKGAIAFAYEHMEVKHNVTFVKIEPNAFESYWERHYWVTDTEGTSYRLVWSKMHHDIKLNQSYTIHYIGRNGIFNALWEYEPNDR